MKRTALTLSTGTAILKRNAKAQGLTGATTPANQALAQPRT